MVPAMAFTKKVMGFVCIFANGENIGSARSSPRRQCLIALHFIFRTPYATDKKITPSEWMVLFFMGWVMGFEPTHVGTTIRGLNRLATPTIYYFEKETIKSAE